LGIGDWELAPTPNPQTPIPNPQSPIPIEHSKQNKNFKKIKIKKKINVTKKLSFFIITFFFN